VRTAVIFKIMKTKSKQKKKKAGSFWDQFRKMGMMVHLPAFWDEWEECDGNWY
jgi:hypothetical protein